MAMIPWLDTDEMSRARAAAIALLSLPGATGTSKPPVRATVEPHGQFRRHGSRVRRNERCPCGSGKKFKACCRKVPV